MDGIYRLAPRLADLAWRRLLAMAEVLRSLPEVELEAPSALPGWSRLTLVCHLRYGAEALLHLTDEALAGRRTSFYPEGRAAQRPGTLVPRTGERVCDVVEALVERSRELHQRWGLLDVQAWSTEVREPVGRSDAGDLLLAEHALLRLTEVEVHGTDAAVGLPDWSGVLIGAGLPFRLGRLAGRHVPPTAVRPDLGSWLLIATDGPVHMVTVEGGSLAVRPADANAAATATLEASSRDLFALLLGRRPEQSVTIEGDVAFGRRFPLVFPGP
ncbi:hypothetical protein HC251_04325 [Iamia sp. SCSIO 61187]|uniref:maleylpyruvate isomerase N-terminal domain-containing protein n=1 Tax=Iamia sp. SCSIO 61187 TaxID=2722752 RepID=UPI001C634E7F|nr:maleylpyruvate isomerase N-terminal domain-containing protein [Iamia sp. SCSIO 61187]QYG91739.1 hypothetical protein HC251_04325 [Iamia sp. SCSIO 61187]